MKSVVNIADIIAAGTQNSDGFSRKQNQIKGGDTKMVIFIKVNPHARDAWHHHK